MTHLLVVVTLLVVMKMGIRYYIWCIIYHMMYYNIQNLARWMQVKVDCGRAGGACSQVERVRTKLVSTNENLFRGKRVD